MGIGYGKLLLFGEHAAVVGFPALGMAGDGYTEAILIEDPTPPQSELRNEEERAHRVFPIDDTELRIAGFDRRTFKLVLPVIRRLIGDFPDFGRLEGELSFRSSVPQESGFGSSAAFCVSLVRLAADRLGKGMSKDEVWKEANSLEEEFHGTPSGIDTGLATFGGIQSFRRDPACRPLAREALPGSDVVLVTAAVPRLATTKELVARVRADHEAGSNETPKHLEALGRAAEEASSALRAGSMSAELIGDQAREAQERLAALGLSTPDLDAAFSAAAGAGALGWKLSGAGGGGAFFCVASGEAHARALVDAVAAGAKNGAYRLTAGPRVVHLSDANHRSR
jgi:mevalonate kinase